MSYETDREDGAAKEQRVEDTRLYDTLDTRAADALAACQSWYTDADALCQRSTDQPTDCDDLNAMRQRLVDGLNQILGTPFVAP